MNDLRLKLSAHWEAGVDLRNEGLVVKTNATAKTWKAQELDWAEQLYDIVRAIDATDIREVRILNTLDGPIGRGELRVIIDNPLLDDREKSLLCHDTRLDRVDALIRRYGQRFGPVRETPGDVPVRTEVKEGELETWVLELIDKGEQHNQNQAYEAARKNFHPRVIQRDAVFRPLYQRHRPVEWTKTGPRSLGKKKAPAKMPK